MEMEQGLPSLWIGPKKRKPIVKQLKYFLVSEIDDIPGLHKTRQVGLSKQPFEPLIR